MAVLEKMRVKFGAALSIIIALALLSFLIDPSTLESALNMMSSKYDVGEINGKAISYNDFQADVERLTQINEIVSGSSTSSEEQQTQIRNAAWQELLYKHLFIKNAKAAGINVGEEEMVALTTGDLTSSVIASDPVFADETGAFSKDRVVELVQGINQDASGQIRTYWNYVQNSVYTQQFYTKYADLFIQSNFQNPLMVSKSIEENNATTNVDFVMVPFNIYGIDSTIVVSNDEIKSYYNNHKSFFKQSASRDIEYVVYEIKPSDDDITATNTAVSDVYDEFSTTTNMKTFLLKNSDRPYSEYWYKENSFGSINSEINDFVNNNNAGTSAIVRDGNIFYAARIMDVAQKSDEAYVKHILLQGEKADSTANVVLAAARGGENFANLAAQYSADQGSADNGELGSIGTLTQDYMIPGFEGVFDARVNDPYILKTQYGTHVVVVTSKSAPVTMKQVALLQKESIASKETINNYYSKANTFASMAAGSYANYKKAVDSLGVYSHPMSNVLESTTSYGAIDQAKELTRWVFDAKKGKTSGIITINNNYFFIATLKEIHKEGYATVAEAASAIKQQLYAEKVAEKTTKEVAEKIAGCADIQAVAEKLGTTVSSQSDITFSSLTSQSLDPAFIGAASVAPEGKLVGPVSGSIGTYVFTVTGRDMGSYYTEDDAKTTSAQINNYYAQTILPVMMNDADVKDNRARFY